MEGEVCSGVHLCARASKAGLTIRKGGAISSALFAALPTAPGKKTAGLTFVNAGWAASSTMAA
ncbi:hypothetical protein [Polaromonas sp.]|uniref:hypothetical protein n=1 Tax=Polaromonas sp. TaxID=1869339 RepID=UPI0037C807DE